MIEKHFNWDSVLIEAASMCERAYEIKLEIDRDVIREINMKANDTLEALNMSTLPNVAKVAGHVAFWIRKLKPVSHSLNNDNKLLTINEVIGILVGVGICRFYFADHSREHFVLSHRIVMDWATSLRNHSHSPHSCAISFEFLASVDS